MARCFSIGVVSLFAACSSVPVSGPQATQGGPYQTAETVRVAAPKGFVEMFVVAVLTTDGGPAVVLQDVRESLMVPIWVGIGEAHAIQLRLEHRRFARPLTHDLFDTVMANLGGELIRVQVDDLQGDMYVGSIYVRRGGGEIEQFDARPSDSIALALGNRAPIFVSEVVIKRIHAKQSEAPASNERPEREFGRSYPSGVQTL